MYIFTEISGIPEFFSHNQQHLHSVLEYKHGWIYSINHLFTVSRYLGEQNMRTNTQ